MIDGLIHSLEDYMENRYCVIFDRQRLKIQIRPNQPIVCPIEPDFLLVNHTNRLHGYTIEREEQSIVE